MSEPGQDIDWTLTTWEGSRRAQLRRALELTLRERLEAIEGLADVARRLEEMRARGEFVSAPNGSADSKTVPRLHEPSPLYDADK